MSKNDLGTIPWEARFYNVGIADTGDYEGVCEIVDKSDNRIASMHSDDERYDRIFKILAAAPELLECLKNLVAIFDRRRDLSLSDLTYFSDARDAIEKAEGKE